MKIDVDFKWNKPVKSVANGALRSKETVLYMAKTWQKLYDPFTPMDSGSLAHDIVDVYVEDGLGIIHHKAPYARNMYYGVSFKFSKEKHSLASAKWDSAAKSAGKKEILIDNVQKYIERRA